MHSIPLRAARHFIHGAVNLHWMIQMTMYDPVRALFISLTLPHLPHIVAFLTLPPPVRILIHLTLPDG